MIQWLKDELNKRQKSSLYRRLPSPTMQNLKVIASSNNYLGLAKDERVLHAAREMILKYGTGSTGSRLTTGNFDIHERLEKELAHFKGTEACLLYSSGYLANLGVITALADRDTIIYSDEYNHASIIDACRLSGACIIVYKHNDMIDLERKMREYKNHFKKLIVTDGVFSMDGDLAPLDQLNDLKEKYNALLIVDDAHGTGVIGSCGRGTSEHFSTKPDVIIGTLSKALGSEGGFVCSNKTIIHYLIQKSRPFIFQTSLSPGNIGAALKSLHIIQTEKRHVMLKEKANDMRHFLRTLNYSVPQGMTPIIPILLGEASVALQFQKKLLELGIFIPAIRPPTVPEHTSRLRCTLMFTHSDNEIDWIKQAFQSMAPDA